MLRKNDQSRVPHTMTMMLVDCGESCQSDFTRGRKVAHEQCDGKDDARKEEKVGCAS